MRTGAAPRPATLLVHDGELSDVRALLAELALPFAERLGGLVESDLQQRWGLVLSTPRRVAQLNFPPASEQTSCIAICDRDSRTLRTSLQRAGIDLMVRRPVHPAALRGLILHALYRGPERRRDARTAIGAPIGFRTWLLQRSAILADLSLGGCRLLTAGPLAPGRRISLWLPPEVAGGSGFGVRARVLRQWCAADGVEHTLSARFERLNEGQRERLCGVLKRYAAGPAVLAPEQAAVAAAKSEPDPAQAADASHSTPQVTPPRLGPPLDDQAARVLLGRDISIGGMRVARDALLRVGQNVRLALHVTGLEVPLVVTARVHRDEGERGMVLRFHALTPEDTRHLRALVDTLPALDPGSPDEGGVVVSEILEHAQAVA